MVIIYLFTVWHFKYFILKKLKFSSIKMEKKIFWLKQIECAYFVCYCMRVCYLRQIKILIQFLEFSTIFSPNAFNCHFVLNQIKSTFHQMICICWAKMTFIRCILCITSVQFKQNNYFRCRRNENWTWHFFSYLPTISHIQLQFWVVACYLIIASMANEWISWIVYLAVVLVCISF